MAKIINLENMSHHACAITGGENAREKLFEMLENSWGIKVKGNPDFSYQKFETLSIDEARNIKEFQENMSFTVSGKKIFVIEADAIAVEAQNALLKMFEEPTENTHFFLLGNCVKNLIPTLQSRVSKMKIGDAPLVSEASGAGKDFLALTTSKRLAFVKKLSDDIKDEKKSKSEALALVNQIEEILYQQSKKDSKLPSKILEDIEKCRDYMSDRSASVKMLLEYVALVARDVI